MAALPGLGFLQALTVTRASTAGTYLAPGGPAVGIGVSAAMLLAWGFHADQVALAVTLTGVWNQLATLGFPTLALALLTLTGGDGAALQTIALIGLVAFLAVAAAFAAALSSSGMARRVGDLAARVVNRLLRISVAARSAGAGRALSASGGRRSGCSAGAGTSSRSRPWRASCRSSWSSWPACAHLESIRPR